VKRKLRAGAIIMVRIFLILLACWEVAIFLECCLCF
jgi:hypothetical protein